VAELDGANALQRQLRIRHGAASLEANSKTIFSHRWTQIHTDNEINL